jgi:hypothetical protein
MGSAKLGLSRRILHAATCGASSRPMHPQTALFGVGLGMRVQGFVADAAHIFAICGSHLPPASGTWIEPTSVSVLLDGQSVP